VNPEKGDCMMAEEESEKGRMMMNVNLKSI
jgi:hypothetical protein